MTTTTVVDLKKSYTEEEREALLDAYIEAFDRKDDKEAKRLLEQMPLEPSWAKAIFEVFGRKELEENYNITEANKEFGEDWMNG